MLVKGEAPDPLPDPVTRAPLEDRRFWARLTRMVFEVDPLLCPRCGGTMKVIAVIGRQAGARVAGALGPGLSRGLIQALKDRTFPLDAPTPLVVASPPTLVSLVVLQLAWPFQQP